MKLLVLIGCTALASIFPSVQAAPPAQPLRWVQADDLRVRSGPSAEYRIVSVLPRGAELILKAGTVDDFCLIEGEGRYGYVACKYLSAKRVARARAGENGVDAAHRWISGNGVTIREEPRQDANVVARLSLNATVKLLRKDVGGGYCEVQAATGPSGYTACRYLVLTPVVLAHIRGETRLDDTPSPTYDPERVFWLDPNWYALEQYAEHLKRRHPEIQPQGPWPRDEALERMKAHLALGIYGRKPAPYADWGDLKRKAAQKLNVEQMQDPAYELQTALGIWGSLHDAISSEGGAERIIRLVRALEFPNVRPSFFRSEAEVAPPTTSTEEASGRFGIIFRQLVSSRPKPKLGNEEGSSAGLYDMLARTQALVRPVHRVQLFRDGRLRTESSVLSRKETLWRDVDEPMCEGWIGGFAFGDAESSIWRYFEGEAVTQKKMNHNPVGSLFEFYTTLDLPIAAAIHTETPVKLNRDETGFVRGTYLHYDLDGDEIADLAIWEGQGKGPGHLEGLTTTDDKWYRLVLININGVWKVLGWDVFGYGCGC